MNNICKKFGFTTLGCRLKGRKHNGANAEARTKPKGYEGSTQQPEDMPCCLNFLKTFAFIKSQRLYSSFHKSCFVKLTNTNTNAEI